MTLNYVGFNGDKGAIVQIRLGAVTQDGSVAAATARLTDISGATPHDLPADAGGLSWTLSGHDVGPTAPNPRAMTLDVANTAFSGATEDLFISAVQGGKVLPAIDHNGNPLAPNNGWYALGTVNGNSGDSGTLAIALT